MRLACGPPFEIVFFDCDSTLTAVEGIDELARRAGVFDQVEPLTRAAMEGRMALEEVYGRRLALIRPDRDAIEWLVQRYLQGLVAGAREAVDGLHVLGKRVHIISGGLRQAVVPLAQSLGVGGGRVHAVDLCFDDSGAYAGFDECSPLVRSRGKALVCAQVVAEGSAAALVGDGSTDLEAAEAGVFIIGFGGIARRENLVVGAHAYIDGPSLLSVLDVLLTPAEAGWARVTGQK